MAALCLLLVVCFARFVTTELTLDEIDQELILSLHNEIRRDQGASNMYKLIWSDSLEDQADDVVEECEFQYSSHPAENLGAMFDFPSRARIKAYGKSNMIKLIIRDGMPSTNFKAWAQEKSNVASFETFRCKEGKVCTHYKQIVTSDAQEIGCAAKYCPIIHIRGREKDHAWFLACVYDNEF
ncbi:cysteine-rich secretory protein LCCL domain-containing 2-like isoform X2 [Gigantopelta aegis]|uniref:cysteine-rich secretory protein LCCL domain-containing 2-like isoform X2 n=1 Tax=Gigantopelta aegis TaxID=1735272 RepID=UPI001B8883F3|nr:cysteine-rich secretory protein LCCL domain-containing 2-like isoform X2 [Gigantopelta aegis]